MEACSNTSLDPMVIDPTKPHVSVENKLVIPESTTGLSLADFIPALKQFSVINAGMIFDYKDKQGNKDARSHVAGLRRIKKPIEDLHKALKADLLAATRKMDADKKTVLKFVEDMIEYHGKPLQDVADEEKRVEHEEWKATKREECWDLAHEMNVVFDRQRELDQQKAEQDRIANEQAEKQRKLNQAQREKEIADKAANEAIERTRRQEEDNRRLEEERKLRQEEQAKADLENIKRVHWLIIPAMVAIGISEDQAKSLILAIRGGEIPAVSINYQWNA